jgi:hypothetical protein
MHILLIDIVSHLCFIMVSDQHQLKYYHCKEQIWCTRAPVLLVFENFENCTSVFHEYIQMSWIQKLRCILSYRKINKFEVVYKDRKLRFLSDLYSSKYNIFSSEISTVPLKCLYAWEYLISDFLESPRYVFQKPPLNFYNTPASLNETKIKKHITDIYLKKKPLCGEYIF